MIRLTPLTRATLPRLRLIERNPVATAWEQEVEVVLLGPTGRTHVGEPGSWLLAAVDDRQVVGAALHYPHDALAGAEYLAAVLLDHRFRGHGLGRELVQRALDDALERSGRPHVAWIVHPDNEAMLHISHDLGEFLGREPLSGYSQFVRP